MKRVFLFLVCAYASLCVVHYGGSRTALADSTSARRGAREAGTTHQASADHEYYVDCSAEAKKGDGRSRGAPWNSIADVNQHTFGPGDTIYFKRESKCFGSLWPKGSGSASAVIRLSAYGRGMRPQIVAGKNDEEAFRLFDQEYWDVDSIEFSGGRLFGVFVSGANGILHHIHLRNLLVHDVYGGEVKHKESGLVVISPGKAQQHFDDVLVEGVTAYGTDQWSGILVGGGNFGFIPDSDWNTRVTVRNSVVHDVYGDGIILFRVKDGLIDSSAAWHTGMQTTESIGTPNAIWTWMCQECKVSNNEAFLTDSPGVDGGAFDIDYGNTRNSVLDNYAHDTQGYCIAVFAAGYVTHDSVVEGNACVNNGESPRLARYQGAIFVYTWNGGVIENLRVEKNTVYWNPPGNFAAVVNRADIRGTQRMFRENQIYSASPAILESNKNLNFASNSYVSCGSQTAQWIFDGRTFAAFDEYRGDSGQEQGSSWKALRTCPNTMENPAVAGGTNPHMWVLSAAIPVRIDAQGLLDASAGAKLLMLKNLLMQFRGSGLRGSVKLELADSQAKEALEMLLPDLALERMEVSVASSSGDSRPKVTLTAPDGSIVREWQDFASPAEIGLAVREKLGVPFYSQMTTDAP